MPRKYQDRFNMRELGVTAFHHPYRWYPYMDKVACFDTADHISPFEHYLKFHSSFSNSKCVRVCVSSQRWYMVYLPRKAPYPAALEN